MSQVPYRLLVSILSIARVLAIKFNEIVHTLWYGSQGAEVCGNYQVTGAECRKVGTAGPITALMASPQTFYSIYQCNTNGLVCRNDDNTADGGCLDYEVRYRCYGETSTIA